MDAPGARRAGCSDGGHPQPASYLAKIPDRGAARIVNALFESCSRNFVDLPRLLHLDDISRSLRRRPDPMERDRPAEKPRRSP